MPVIIERKIFVACPRGHVDEIKEPGFGIFVDDGGKQTLFLLCRFCYHQFFMRSFPGEAMPLTATRAEAEARAVELQMQTEMAVKQFVEEKGASNGE